VSKRQLYCNIINVNIVLREDTDEVAPLVGRGMQSLWDRGRRDDDGDVSSDPEQQLREKGQGRNKDKEKQKIMIPIGFNIGEGECGQVGEDTNGWKGRLEQGVEKG
jgi:hypothetical protein